MNIYSIYLITNIVNNKKYIGKSKNPQKRFRRHISEAKRSKTCFYESIIKYGPENFILTILETDILDEEYAYQRESYWIAKHDTIVPNGYNMNSGGIGSLNPSIITRNKISVALTGRKLSDETKRKISSANIGKTDYSHSQETKTKLSLSASKRWKLTKNTGESLIVTNLKNFAKMNDYSISSLKRVMNNIQLYHKDIIAVVRI